MTRIHGIMGRLNKLMLEYNYSRLFASGILMISGHLPEVVM